MNRVLALIFVLSLSGPASARETQGFDEDTGRTPGQQKMEEEPSSTTIGGSRGGQLDVEKKRDNLRNKKTQEDRRLFERDQLYRRGF